MNAESIAAVSVVTVLLVQMLKWGGIPDRRGPIAVMAVAAAGVALYRFSLGGPLTEADAWPLFVGWITVSASSAGVYGFSRSLPEAVTATKKPPPGAAQQPTGRF